MLKRLLAFGFLIMGTTAQADDWKDPTAEYDESYLQIEECFANETTDREACVIAGIQECANDLEAVLESKGLYISEGTQITPYAYCYSIGLERVDEYLSAALDRTSK